MLHLSLVLVRVEVLHSFLDELGDELMFDLDVDLEADDATRPGPGTLRGNSHRPRFPPY